MRRLTVTILFGFAVSVPSVARAQATDYEVRSIEAYLCSDVSGTGAGIGCKPIAKGTHVSRIGVESNGWVEVMAPQANGFIEIRTLEAVPSSVTPCTDPLYLRLRAHTSKDLSDRDYQLLLERERACTQYQTALVALETQKQIARNTDRTATSTHHMVVIQVSLLLLGFLIGVANSSQ